MDLRYSILHYFGIALLIISGVFIWYFIKNANNEKGKLTLLEVYKKHYLYAVIAGVSLVASFIFFEASFWTPGKNNFMIDHSFKSYNPGRMALSYIFVIIDAIAWLGIIFGFHAYKNFKEESKQVKLYTLLTWSISIPVVVISTILYLEGNAPYIDYPMVNAIHIGKQGIELINHYVHTGHDFDGLNIAFYAICILGGAFTVLVICDHFMFKYYHHHGLLYTCFFIAVPCGIIGARIWYVCIDLFDKGVNSDFYHNFGNVFKIWEGGLAIMGGAVLGIIGGVTVMIVLTYVMKKPIYKDLKLLHVMDIIIPCILVAQAIGRWGNFFNNEVYGFPIQRSSVSFLPSWLLNNMVFESHGSGKLQPGEIFLPLFLIESITNTIGYFFIYFGIGRGFFTKWIIKFINLFSSKDKPLIKEESYHANGTLLGWYLLWYGATRAILEPMRTSADMYQSSIVTSYILIGSGAAIILFFILFNEIYTKRIRVARLANSNIKVTLLEDDSVKSENEEKVNLTKENTEESLEEPLEEPKVTLKKDISEIEDKKVNLKKDNDKNV